MKYIIICSIFIFLNLNLILKKDNPENSVETTVIFDAYENDIFFFTDVSTKKALVLYVEDSTIIDDYKLIEGDDIGEVFKITWVKNDNYGLIKKISKISEN